jgi:hypothetical protein
MENKKVIIETTQDVFNEDEFNEQILSGTLSEVQFTASEWVDIDDDDDEFI